ncbi:MAG: type II secretion system protein GspE [Halobacteriovoraceae bacterium]|nr:type II secretion system protein GspE [Halobacteriovoraceae bacterium]|tara:strand:+ start:2510 stop:4252 length:1743 start_codon:yes stop_codon:yes gene_type:complete
MDINESHLQKVESHKQKIGELLLEHTSLTQEQLDEALQLQEEEHKLLGDILLTKNYIHPHDIIKVLCHQINIPYLDEIKVDEIDPMMVKDISINYAKQHNILPILESDYSVTLAMSDPFDFYAINDLTGIFKKKVHIVVSTPLRIQDAINRVYEKANQNLVDSIEDEFEENLDLDGPIDILDASADEAPVIRFVNSIIFRAVKERASDIHIEPYEKDVVYRFRINRVMTEILRQPKKTHSAVSSRIKVMAKLDIAEKRLPQDGRIKIKIAGKDIDIRLSTVPVQNGERIVMRVLEKTNTVLELEHLGFEGRVLQGLKDFSTKKHGVLYVTGPTGHGKTTTLFAVLDRMNTPDRMIITVEDPVEYEIAGISQIQVNSKIDLSFARALRAILRQNPDVVMVGETRDRETAEMAIQASLTGHFVLSTLHTNDASSAPTRLIDMGVQPFLISSSLVGVLAQRLVRVLCEHCKTETELSEYEMQMLDLETVPPTATIYKPVGCEKCTKSGYGGVTVVSELLVITDTIRNLILQKEDASKIKRAAIKEGMEPLAKSAINKIFLGITSVEEVLRAIISEADEDSESA